MDLLVKILIIIGIVFFALAAFKVPERDRIAYGWMGAFLFAVAYGISVIL